MKILIILASGIGNSVLFSPSLMTLREHYPDAVIDIFAYKKPFAEPFRGSRMVNDLICYEGVKSLLKLRKRKYDISITAFPSNKWQFNLFAFLVGAEKRITHSYKVGRVKTLSFLQNYKIQAVETLHDIDQNLNLLSVLKIEKPSRKQTFFFTNQENEAFAEKFAEQNKLSEKYLIGVHPGSGFLTFKRAPVEKFLELIRKNEKENTGILIFGGDEEKGIKEKLKEELGGGCIVDTDLKNAAALIKKCDLFITNDTGLMHIAAASEKTKIIAVFNGTNPVRTRPCKENSEIIVLKENRLKYPFHSTKAGEE